MTRHTAIVTGSNHGIGAATAVALAMRGTAVLCAYWRVHDEVDPGIPQAYRDRRAGNADEVVAEIEAARAMGCAEVLSEDLSHRQDYSGVTVTNPFHQ
ncbi:MAG TPA: hypothetical protein VF834_07120 [Streptosporangiaceae bacterium]